MDKRKILNPVKTVIPKIRVATVQSMSKLSEKTLAKTEAASSFLTDFADVETVVFSVINSCFFKCLNPNYANTDYTK